MKIRKNRGVTDATKPIEVIPGLERLKARLRPGQYLRARVLRYLDENKLLLRLLGRTVVASSARRLRSNQEVWVRVKSVGEKIHLQLVQPEVPAITAGEASRSNDTYPNLSPVGLITLPDVQERVKVLAGATDEEGQGGVVSIVLELEETPRTTLRFSLERHSNSLSIRMHSQSEDLVEEFLRRRSEVEAIATRLGFGPVHVGIEKTADEGEPLVASGHFVRGIDLVI
jgi:hypothetical protein